MKPGLLKINSSYDYRSDEKEIPPVHVENFGEPYIVEREEDVCMVYNYYII